MSEPTRTGVAREGQPVHPVKVRVEGVPPGPLADQLVDRFRAPLGQFHRAQQQNVRNSGEVQVHRAQRDLGGATATYVNSFGQEQLTLRVHPRTVTEAVLNPGDEFWDYALIELTIPAGDAETYYVRVEIDGEPDEWADSEGDGEGDILKFAEAGDEPIILNATDTNYRMSLLVDLRNRQPGGVKLNLSARLEPSTVLGIPGLYPNDEMDPETPYTIVEAGTFHTIYRMIHWNEDWAYAASGSGGGMDEYNQLAAHFPDDMAGVTFVDTDLVGAGNGTINVEPYYNMTDPPWSSPSRHYPGQWVWPWDEVDGGVDPGDGSSFILGPDPQPIFDSYEGNFDTVTNWPDTTVFRKRDYAERRIDGVISDGPIPIVTGQVFLGFVRYKQLSIPRIAVASDAEATLTSIFFDGSNPLNARSRYQVLGSTGDDLDTSDQWERSGRPERWPLKEVATVMVPAKAEPEELLGQIIVDPHKQRGSVTFDAA